MNALTAASLTELLQVNRCRAELVCAAIGLVAERDQRIACLERANQRLRDELAHARLGPGVRTENGSSSPDDAGYRFTTGGQTVLDAAVASHVISQNHPRTQGAAV